MTIAIGAIIAIGALLIANWDEIKEAAGKLKDWLLDKFGAIKDGISKAIEGIKSIVMVIGNNIFNVAKHSESHIDCHRRSKEDIHRTD